MAAKTSACKRTTEEESKILVEQLNTISQLQNAIQMSPKNNNYLVVLQAQKVFKLYEMVKDTIKKKPIAPEMRKYLKDAKIACAFEEMESFFLNYPGGKCEEEGISCEATLLSYTNLIAFVGAFIQSIAERISTHRSGSCRPTKKKCKICTSKKDLTKLFTKLKELFNRPNSDDDSDEPPEEENKDGYKTFTEKKYEVYNELTEWEENCEDPIQCNCVALYYKDVTSGEITWATFLNDDSKSAKQKALVHAHIIKDSIVERVIKLKKCSVNLKESGPTEKKKRGPPMGRKEAPVVEAELEIPTNTEGQLTPHQNLRFFIDTGADGGSVGFGDWIKNEFLYSFEKINNEDKPVVYARIYVGGKKFDKIHSFDVDPDKKWNALGMDQVEEFYLLTSKDGSLLLNPKHVNVTSTDGSIVPDQENPQPAQEVAGAKIYIATGEEEVEKLKQVSITAPETRSSNSKEKDTLHPNKGTSAGQLLNLHNKPTYERSTSTQETSDGEEKDQIQSEDEKQDGVDEKAYANEEPKEQCLALADNIAEGVGTMCIQNDAEINSTEMTEATKLVSTDQAQEATKEFGQKLVKPENPPIFVQEFKEKSTMNDGEEISEATANTDKNEL